MTGWVAVVQVALEMSTSGWKIKYYLIIEANTVWAVVFPNIYESQQNIFYSDFSANILDGAKKLFVM